jgi:hypothetical protein
LVVRQALHTLVWQALLQKSVGPLQQVPNQRRQKILAKKTRMRRKDIHCAIRNCASFYDFVLSFFLSFWSFKKSKKIFESRQIYFYSTTHNP